MNEPHLMQPTPDDIQPTTAFDDKIAIIRQALELLPDEEV